MRIERNYVYTRGTAGPQRPKGPKLTQVFQKGALIDTQRRSLAGRVTKPKSVTQRGKTLSKEVGRIASKISSPFLTSS